MHRSWKIVCVKIVQHLNAIAILTLISNSFSSNVCPKSDRTPLATNQICTDGTRSDFYCNERCMLSFIYILKTSFMLTHDWRLCSITNLLYYSHKSERIVISDLQIFILRSIYTVRQTNKVSGYTGFCAKDSAFREQKPFPFPWCIACLYDIIIFIWTHS